MSEYYIPNHVHVAFAGNAAVFLDLRMDQYRMFVGSRARTFKGLLPRANDSFQRVIPIDESVPGNSALASQIIADLLSNNLLTSQRLETPVPIPSHIQLPHTTLLENIPPSPPHIDFRQVLNMLRSCVVARTSLHLRPFEQTVRAVARRKQVHRRGPMNLEYASRLVMVYNRIRPLFPQDFSCLFDSLSLLEFLAHHNCFPDWIFGVHVEPWGAHCWVQYDGVAFNEDPDHARTYFPVMVV